MTIQNLQAHYGFTQMPFGKALSPQMLHRHKAHGEAMARIGWCLNERALGVITGEVGAGKTVAVRASLAALDPSRTTIVYLGNPAVGARGLYAGIVTALGGTPRYQKSMLIPQTAELLAAEEHERGRSVVIILDEAHLLGVDQLNRRLVLCSAGAGLTSDAARWTWRHRHSPAVAAWAPSRGIDRRAGPLQVRILGSGEPVVLLLHGMVAAGNSFGAAYDTLSEHATVVVPDLLGFGGSMSTTQVTDASAHIAALDAALAALGLDRRPTVVAGHSMGGCLALRWAAQHTDLVRSVLTFGAPLYLNRAEADEHVASRAG